MSQPPTHLVDIRRPSGPFIKIAFSWSGGKESLIHLSKGSEQSEH